MKAGWEIKSFAEIAEVKGGKRLPKGYSLQSIPTAHSYITVSDFTDDGTVDISRIRYISDEIFEEIKRYTISTKDLYLSIAGTIGKTGRIPPELDGANLTENACKLVFYPKINRDYVYYFTLSNDFIEQAGLHTRTAAQPKLALERLKTIKLAIPNSEAEQQRIVAILDEAFEAIAAARANAEQNRQNAQALFESYLQSVFSQRGEGWVDTTIAAATGGVFTGPFGSLLHKSDYIEHGIPLVNPAHITSVGIEPDLRKTVSEETAQRLSNYIMRAGDIVIGRRGEMGRCAIVTDIEDGWLCGTGSFVIKPSERCDARYLVRLLRSESCKTQLENIAGGAVMPNLSNTDLSNFPIILPPIDMQRSVLRKIDLMAEKTQHLESLYQRKIAALDELKQSLLQQAFNGSL